MSPRRILYRYFVTQMTCYYRSVTACALRRYSTTSSSHPKRSEDETCRLFQVKFELTRWKRLGAGGTSREQDMAHAA